MSDSIENYRKRRDSRLQNRLDEEKWITINGTHVMVDDDGQVSKGPSELKSVVKKSGGYKPGTKKTGTPKFKTVDAFKKALSDRDAAMSEKVMAEEKWKEAKAFRASMFGKNEETLKKDIEQYKKTGDRDKLERAQHDLDRYQDRVKKYGKDFGVADAEKKMNDAEKRHGELDKQIKDFEAARGYGKVDSPKSDTLSGYSKAKETTSDDDFVKEGYKKNPEGRWVRRGDSFDVRSGMSGNITDDIYGDWGSKIKSVPSGTSFSVKSSNRWHDEVERFTKTDTGWRFERTVDGRDADKGNADLGRIWNSLHDGRLWY